MTKRWWRTTKRGRSGPGWRTFNLDAGNVFSLLNRHDEAMAAYDEALTLRPDLADAQLGRGHTLFSLNRHDEALAAYDKALALKPDLAEAWNGRGNILNGFKRHDEASTAFDKALAFKPGLVSAQLGRGNVFLSLDRWDEAMAAYDATLSVSPDLAEAWLGRGNVFSLLNRQDEAVTAYDAALSAKPDLAEAWPRSCQLCRFFASVLTRLFLTSTRRFPLRPDLTGVEGGRLHSKMQLCDWHNFNEECQSLIASVRNNKANASPFAFLGISEAPEDQMTCAELWIAKYCPASGGDWRGTATITIDFAWAYLSADFGNHPVSYLMAGAFEQHDRKRFETIAISLGPHDGSETRARVGGCVRIASSTSKAAATKILRDY